MGGESGAMQFSCLLSVLFFFFHSYPKIIMCIYFCTKKKKDCFMRFTTAFLSEISAEEFFALQASTAIQSQKARCPGRAEQ